VEYGPNAPRHLKRTNGFSNAPDILVISQFDPDTGEVAAFEELVGSHGGLGGSQTQPFLLFPTVFARPDEPIVGAGSLHRVFKNWLSELSSTSSADASLLRGETVGVDLSPIHVE